MELVVNKVAIAALGAFLVTACGRDVEESYLEQDVTSEKPGEVFDEDAARELAREEVAADGYSGPCTSDCSGHDAGFEWAADGNPDGGISSSPSFDEGQEAFEEAVEERVGEYREEFEAEAEQ